MNFEVNHVGNTLIGAIAVGDVVEGRMVKLTSHTWDYDFGSKTDLPGCMLPRSATEASQSHYFIAFAEDNRSLPIFQPNPSFTYALRQGWDQAANVPFAATVYLTHPGNMDNSQTIASGSGVKLFGQGSIVTLPSGSYVYSSEMEVPGSTISVYTTAGNDRGKPQYSASNIVAEVVGFDTSNSNVTLRVL
jgi:hypothetical protein